MKKLLNYIKDFFKNDETEEFAEFGKSVFDLNDDELFEVCVAEIIAMNAWGV